MWHTYKGFAGLKSKMYSFVTEEIIDLKKQKYINKNVVDDKLKYQDYKNVFFNKSYMRHEMDRIQDKEHNIGSVRINNIYLFYDDKKYIIEGGYSRLSHFHKSTR